MQPIDARLVQENEPLYVPAHPELMYFAGPPEAQDKLTTALADAMAEFAPIYNEDEGQIGHRRFTYASLDALRAATMPALTKRKILVLQPISGPYGDGIYRITTMVLGHGARIVAIFEFQRAGATEGNNALQEFGKQQTYLRRYAYRAMFLLDGSDDADAAPAPLQQRQQPAQAPRDEQAPRTVASEQKTFSTQDIAALHAEIQGLLRVQGIREPKAMQAELERLSDGREFNRNPQLLIMIRNKLSVSGKTGETK
jgi:hypothetical protein